MVKRAHQCRFTSCDEHIQSTHAANAHAQDIYMVELYINVIMC